MRSSLCGTLLLFGLCVGSSSASDLAITALGMPYFQSFNSFTGSYHSLPEGWGVSKDGGSLMGAGDEDFRGVHGGGVTAGGCYAWRVGTNDLALGYQPTADEFTPGYFMLVISNATRTLVRRITLSYEVVYLNNADRSSSLDLEFSLDGRSFSRVCQARVCTPEKSETPPSWTNECRFLSVTFPAAIRADRCVWLRWCGDDVGGSGSRDEYGINNVRIVLYPPAGTIIELR